MVEEYRKLTDLMCQAQILKGANSIAFIDNVTGIDERPEKWPDGEISYRLNNYSKDFPVQHQIRAVTVSLRAWQLRINKIRFRRERNPDVAVDLDVTFEPQSHFSSEGILAHAFYPSDPIGPASGNVHINDGWNWVSGVHLSDMANPPLIPIMIHEFGHSLGLKHDTLTTSQDEIMYPSFNLGKKKTTLGPRDIERIQAKYGTRNLSQRILDYFMNRRALGWDFK